MPNGISIRTDPDRLQQCLINLAFNAIKFTEQGHVYLKVYLKVSLKDKDDKPYIRFDVEDTGIGNAPEKLADMFEPFTQADGGNTLRYGGDRPGPGYHQTIGRAARRSCDRNQ